MEPPCKILDQIAFNTRPEIGEHMLIVMDKSNHEEHLAHPKLITDKVVFIQISIPELLTKLNH